MGIGGGGRRRLSTTAADEDGGGGEACFSGWLVWEVMVDDVQQTTEEATCSKQRQGRWGASGWRAGGGCQ
jgi:hypothetical protein